MEFQENQVYTPEFILAYHPDGLRDLDINLNENCAKFLSSGVAIPRFRYVSNCLLNSSTKGKAAKLTEKYLDQLIQAKWIGLEQGQELLVRNKWFYRQVGERIRNRIITHLPMEFCWKYKPYPLAKMEFSICPDRFYEITQNYTTELLKAVGLDTERNIVLNQAFPGNNPVPYMRYYKDSRAIVVDRDPRDVFVFLKYVFPGHSYSIPLKDVEVFCEYFEHMHKNLKETLNHPDVLYIRFEDLVYHYESTTEKVRDFLGLGDNKHIRKYFVPEESEVNTQVYKQFENCDEINIIEDKLRLYLYDFKEIACHNPDHKVFDDNPKSMHYSFKG